MGPRKFSNLVGGVAAAGTSPIVSPVDVPHIDRSTPNDPSEVVGVGSGVVSPQTTPDISFGCTTLRCTPCCADLTGCVLAGLNNEVWL